MSNVRLLPGVAVITVAVIHKKSVNVQIQNPEQMSEEAIKIGEFGRVHSVENGNYDVWILEEKSFNTIIVKIPLVMMGQLFVAHPHRIFPHFA